MATVIKAGATITVVDQSKPVLRIFLSPHNKRKLFPPMQQGEQPEGSCKVVVL